MSNKIFPTFIKVGKNKIMNTKYILSMGIFPKTQAKWYEDISSNTFASVVYFKNDQIKDRLTCNEHEEMYTSVQKCIDICSNLQNDKDVENKESQNDKSSLEKERNFLKNNKSSLKKEQNSLKYMPFNYDSKN